MSEDLIPVELLARTILVLRGQKVLLDSDLACLYGVTTTVLNQPVKRNTDRVPRDFMFQLTTKEAESLRSQFVTLKRGEHRKYRAFAFTEQGVAMPEKTKRAIGFHVRETSPRYRTRKAR